MTSSYKLTRHTLITLRSHSSDYHVQNPGIFLSRPRVTVLRASRQTRPLLFHTSASRSALQNIFETPERPSLSIVKLNERGFHLSDRLVIPGGVIISDHRAFLWDVDPPSPATPQGWGGWSKERFAIFESVSPRPEILLFGTGQTVVPPPAAIKEYVSSLGVQMDVMDSRNAASTYNLLIEEGRRIAVALCPLEPINPRSGDSR
ncbi:hypothetical protein M231_00842 [Tremella mesenterica]|uniref:NADH dehydrogenase [ubiquinone] 1 alpha subcomplex assembly factor 3 n=1 Tax=Tremella mesenterica TaxID=5217 RepID=A0A4Q1BUN3_TREME|nr:hypothetical protein M231_00842 [Tremella mesenterica]